MARIFDITAAATKVNLTKRKGEISFTATNTGATVRGRARVIPLGSVKKEWLLLNGEAERDFPANGMHQFTVRISPTADAPEGSYSFRLNVVSVNNPDEDFAEGAAVAFDVPPPPPPGKPFPWRKVGVAAAVVIGAGLTWWLFSGGGVKVPNLEHMEIGPAIIVLQEAKLVLGGVKTKVTNDPHHPPGTVFSQSPDHDKRVPAGSKVDMVIAVKDGKTKVSTFIPTAQLLKMQPSVVDVLRPRAVPKTNP